MQIIFNKKFLIPALAVLIIDITWLKFVMGPHYAPMIKEIQGTTMNINIYYAIAAYICVLILLYIIIKNNLTLTESFLVGVAGWGLYDFTAGAVIKKWSLPLALLDVLWGGTILMSMKFLSDKL
jgi:uncharacterized membrane protein